MKVKIVSLDTEAIDKKSKWVQGDTLTLQIEGHGTVGMAKQRIALLVGAHEKDLVEEMNFPEGTKLNDIIKLEEIPNFGNGSTLFVHVKMPTVVLSDDEGLRAEEEPEPPAMASPEVRSKELTEEEQDKQGALKQETAMQMVSPLMAIIQANHDEVMAVMRETRHRVQRLEARLDAGRVPGPAPQAASSAASSSAAAGSSALVTASSVSPVPPLGSATALPSARLARLLVGKASRTLEQVGVDATQLREAIAQLEPPLSAERAAQAYDNAREVRKDCPSNLEEVGKNAALVVREVLVLQICCSAGSLSDVGFESALEQAFRRQLGPELRSQLHLARSAICRIGQDRVLFERQAPKVYGPTVTPEELNQMFPAYADCAVSVDRPGSARPNQPPTSKRRKKQRDRVDSDREGHRAEAAATDAEMAVEAQHRQASVTANNAAENVLSPLLGEPAYVPELQREWTGGPFIPASERAPSQPAQHWYGHQPFQQQARPCRGLQPARNPGRFLWHARGGKGGVVDVELADWFEAVPLAPIGRTKTNNIKAKVAVVERCCLDSLRKTEGKLCLIVIANEGVLLKQNNGSAKTVFQGSDLCAIMEATVSEKTGSEFVPLPKHGGYYARSVLVHYKAGSCESSMVLMRTLWRTPEAEDYAHWEQTEDDRTRLLNVLHKCRAQGHTELVFGAWGLLEHTSPEEMVRISELLHDAVLGSNDVAKSFTKITFALGHLGFRFSDVLREKVQSSCSQL